MSDAPEQNARTARPAIGRRLRFDVFKRDKFTCQYCGQSAPQVVLHCDHVRPVVDGGPTELLNLITSCAGCNLGKGAIPLGNAAAVDRQQQMLADLEERRQQIDMMIEWRDELKSHSEDVVGKIAERMVRGRFRPSEAGIDDIRKWLLRHSADAVLRAADEAFTLYIQRDDSGDVTGESWSTAFSKIPTMLRIHAQEVERPHLGRLLYIQGILRNKARIRHLDWVDYLEHLHGCGAELDAMEVRAKRARHLTDFSDYYDAWLEQIGRPF